VSFIKLNRIQPFKLLKTRYKLKTRSVHVEALLAVKIVFQFRNRCTVPTCAIGHHARDFWRRFSAGRYSSACSVYALWTVLRKFSLRIEFVLSIAFLFFVIKLLSIKLFLRDEANSQFPIKYSAFNHLN